VDACKYKALKLWRHWDKLSQGQNENNPHVKAILTCMQELEIYFQITEKDKEDFRVEFNKLLNNVAQ